MSAKRPATKATDELIDLAEQSLAQRFLKGDVKRLLRERFKRDHPGKTICPRTLEAVLSAARKRLVAAAGRPRQDLIDESLQFYNAIVRNPGAAHRDRLRAQESIDRLLGLNAPLRHEVTGKDGGPLQTRDLSKLTDAELATLETLAARVAPSVAPSDAGPGAAGSRAARPGGDPGGAGPA